MKMKNIAAKIGDDLTQMHNYIDANQEFTRCGNHPNILPLFERLGRFLTFLLSFLRHEAHPHLVKLILSPQMISRPHGGSYDFIG
jgi:hypothetical protein